MSRRHERDVVSLLTFTTLYPNAQQPRQGLFVERRLLELLATREARSAVVAPVPWFPFSARRFGRYGVYARVPARERRDGVDVTHPRYAVVPKFGMAIAPALLAAGARRHIRRLQRGGFEFQVIDAHYFYPDGVAAALLGRSLGRPVVVTARGTDVNLFPEYRSARRQILWAARHCAAIITVAEALKDRLVGLGVPGERITVLRNGVDLERFRPVDPEDAKRRLGLRGPILVSVGNLLEGKGHHLVIDSLDLLPDVRLVIVGEGELERALRSRAAERGVSERVTFAGPVPNAELRYYYSAADALVLASLREGMANVLLEALACGTPVISTAVGGSPEVVRRPEAGVLMERRDAASVATAYRRLLAGGPDRSATRRYAEGFGWEPTTRGQLEIFRRVAGSSVR